MSDDLMMQKKQEANEATTLWSQTLLLAFLLVTLLFQRVHHMYAHPSGMIGADLAGYLLGTQNVLAHRPLYASVYPPNEAYTYPPLVAYLTMPLTHLSASLSTELWLCLNFLVFLTAILLFFISNDRCEFNIVNFCIAAIVTFTAQQTLQNLALGQCNGMMLLLICLSKIFYNKKATAAAGAILGLGVLLKTWMILFLALPLMKRDARMAGGMALTIVVGMLLLFLPLAQNEFIDFCRVTLGFASGQSQPGSMNYVYAVTSKLGVLGKIILGTYTAAIVTVLILLFRRASNQDTPGQIESEYCAFSIAVLLLIPRTQVYYLVIALPALWSYLTIQTSSSPGLRHLLFLGAAALYALTTWWWLDKYPYATAFIWLLALYGLCVIDGLAAQHASSAERAQLANTR